MIHTLKTWPDMFRAVERGEKTHEIRKNDRDYAVGDVIVLHEWTPDVPEACRYDAKGLTGQYSGNMVAARVTFVTPGGTWGLPDEMCVMSIRRVS